MTYPTDIHTPASSAPGVTNLVAECAVCHTQWQVQSAVLLDAKACPFCHAGDEAISLISEAPEFGGATIYVTPTAKAEE